jgi:Family of unknown function (DUF6636)
VRRGILIATAALLGLALVLPATSFAGSGLRFFHTSDGNISCGMVKHVKKNKKKRRSGLPGEARCDVVNHTWVAPPRPPKCELDWGFGVAVGDKGFGSYVCAGASVAGAKPNILLGPGSVITLGTYTCSVLPVADPTVHCANNRTGHGFEVSAAAVSLF